MTQPTKRRFILGLALLAAILGAGTASALTYEGYVGSVRLSPSKAGVGSSGSIQIFIYSEPGAGGTTVAIATICSIGATDSFNCDLSTTAFGPKYLLSGPQLLALYKALVEAAAKNLRVSLIESATHYHYQGITILAAP